MGTNIEIPESVQGDARDHYAVANHIRAEMKAMAKDVNELRLRLPTLITPDGDRAQLLSKSEAIANATIAYRHLEDASMRLGKVLQALDGGVSVYDRATTVGA
ncbi:MAG TPA: hypothetical protein VHZ95_20955 [Polyangiales bacterium]|nr:hypothetical protein [Polyangiales bacterium]